MCSTRLRRGSKSRPPSSSPKPSRGPAAERGKKLQHPLERGVVGFRDGQAGFGCQSARMQEKIERVNVIVEGLLKIESIRTHLPLRFLQQDFPAFAAPSLR